jgi:hypothetical protein
MKSHPAPRLALRLLEWTLPDHEPLAGDLVEVFEHRQSRLWFWYQALAAIAISLWRRPVEIRPLKLVDHRTLPLREDPRTMPRKINLSASPTESIGGIGLVTLGTLVTIVQPAIWWCVLLAIVSGICLGIARILAARRSGRDGASGDGHVLFTQARLPRA